MSLRSPRYLPQVLFVVLGVAGACSLQVPDEKEVFSNETGVGGKHAGGRGGGMTSGGTSSTDIGGDAGLGGTTTTPSGGIAGASGGTAEAGQAGANKGGATSTAGNTGVGGKAPTNGGTSGASGTSVGTGGASGGVGAAAGRSSGGTAGASGNDTAGNAGLGGTAGAAGLVGTGGFVNPLSIGLVHHFKFDDTGTTLADSVDPTKLATVMGAAATTSASCKWGRCVQVRQNSGSVDFVNLPDGLLSGLNATTISMWVLTLSNMRNGAKAFDFGSGTGTNVFVVPHGTNPATTQTGAEFGGASGGLTFVDLWSEGDLTSSSTAPIWHLFTVTWDATQITFYVDGTSRSTKASPSILPSAINATQNVLGKGVSDTTGMYARFDDLRIYDRALTPELVMGLYSML